MFYITMKPTFSYLPLFCADQSSFHEVLMNTQLKNFKDLHENVCRTGMISQLGFGKPEATREFT